MDRPRPWLRYVDAADLGDADIEFEGLDVRNGGGEKLGDVDGFIIDADSGTPYYVVVDSGGWFKSKHFLLPVGHARFDPARQMFVADLERDRIDRFPGFDKDAFEKLSDEELEQIDLRTAAVCCPSDVVSSTTGAWGDRWSHYRQPDWWQSNYYRPDRAGARGIVAGADMGRASAHDRSRKE